MSRIFVFAKVFAIFAIVVTLFGFVLPFLISMKSSMAVIVGVAILAMCVSGLFLLLDDVIRFFKDTK